MSKSLKIIVAIILVAVLAVAYVATTYNRYIALEEDVISKWSQVDNQLERRFDLIPNLVESVKGVTKQEQAVFGEIANARSRYAGASTLADRTAAATEVNSALARLLVITENYPQLKSSEAFISLMTQLEGTENRLSVARKDYNDSVQVLNTNIKRFPSNLVASLFNIEPKPYFEIKDEAKQNPEVKF
jgi:LemA protein